tara:strand:- start:410 stop:859 length:450 start_codon:yes stop_codon:yes gene_type:complete
MSDFSELCPLFNTGVFNEITFPNISMSKITLCGNGLLGSLTCGSATRTAVFTFGRTVIITDAFVRRIGATVEGAGILRLEHKTTLLAAGSVFGTFTVSTTGSGMEHYTWCPMAVSDKTFTSDAILGFTTQTGSAASAGAYDLMLRYKEA